MTSQDRTKSRARRAAVIIGETAAAMLVFLAAAITGVVVHLGLPATRRVVAAQANDLMDATFAGEVTVERIGRLGVSRVAGVRVRVRDPDGVEVLYVDGLRARFSAFDVLRSVLLGQGAIDVRLDTLSVDYADVSVDVDGGGRLRLANALEPEKDVGEEALPDRGKLDARAREVRFDAPETTVKHAWVHGAAPPVDIELANLVGSAHLGPELVRAILERVDLVARGFPRGADVTGTLRGRVSAPSETGKDLGLEATFDGAIAGIATIARGRLDGRHVEAVVDAHDPSGRGVRSTFGELPVQEDLRLHARASGELPRIAGRAQMMVGARGTVELDAALAIGATDAAGDAGDGTRVTATLAARHVDLRAIFPSAPRSDLGLNAQGSLALREGHAPQAELTLRTLPSRMAGESLPILRARGELAEGRVQATARVIDPRATAELDIDVRPPPHAGEGRLVEVQLQADVRDLSGLPVVGAKGANMSGRVSVEAQLRTHLAPRPMPLQARVHLRGGGIGYGAGHVDDVRVLATATGTVEEPVVELGVHSADLRWGDMRAASMDVRGVIEPRKVVVIHAAHVDLVEEGTLVSATASRAEIGDSRIAVDDVLVQGLGEPVRGSFSRDTKELRAAIDAPRIDLPRLATLAGREAAVRQGSLAVHGDVALGREEARGVLHVEVEAFSAASIHGASAMLDADVAGREIVLAGHGEIANAARFEVATRSLVLAGAPTDLGSWRNAWGRASFGASLQLSKLSSLLPPGALPVDALAGDLSLRGTIGRDGATAPPELSVHARTGGLAAWGPAALGGDEAIWRVAGVDLALDVRTDAISGLVVGAIRAFDRKGTLVALDAKALVPYAGILAEPSRAAAALETSPFAAKLIVPKRALAQVPLLVSTKELLGTIEAEVDVNGTALDPRVALVARARDVRAPRLALSTAADADLTLAYDGSAADMAVTVRSEHRDLLTAASHVDVRARDLIEPTGVPLDWNARGRVELEGFPLDALDAFMPRRVRGRVSGKAVLEDLHRDAKLFARMGVEDFRVGGAAYSRGTVEVDARNGKLVAGARLEQADGHADVRVTSAMRWGAALTPEVDPQGPLEAHVDAKAFRIAALLPFVSDVFDQLDGRVDAGATLSVGTHGVKTGGHIVLRNGVVRLAAVGPLLTDIHALMILEPNGRIRIPDLRARGGSGQLEAKGEVEMRGLAFEAANASIRIPARHPVDLSVAGQPLGEISGNVNVRAEASPARDRMMMRVDVPDLSVSVPATALKAGVQDLSERDDVRVGVYLGPGTFVQLPMDRQDFERTGQTQRAPGLAIDVDVRLAGVTLVYGRMARVVLRGNPRIGFIADETTVTGRVEATEGSIEIQGKEFEIEKATVTFQPGEPSNPVVVATASWSAPDGTKVFADFAGPWETGRVSLRSEPARPQNEILALILFGTAEGMNARPPPPGRDAGAGVQAARTIGGLAAQGLTEAIQDLTGVRTSARIDTSRARNPAPEIEIQISPRLAVEYSHVLGTPPLSRPDKNLVSFEWRVSRRWSIETTVGDRGTLQMDAIWQRRY